VNNGVHFVEEEPILLCNMVRLLAAENQLSEFSLFVSSYTFVLRNKVAQNWYICPSALLSKTLYLSSPVSFVIASVMFTLYVLASSKRHLIIIDYLRPPLLHQDHFLFFIRV
jgi:hypothetical protein